MKSTASTMPPALRAEINADPEYTRCAIDLPMYTETYGECSARITREHAIINAGKKLQEKWAIPPFCAKHHGVDEFQDAHTEVPKRMREWVALNRATDEQLMAYPKSEYLKLRMLRNREFGIYIAPPIPERAGPPGIDFRYTAPVVRAPMRRLTQEELFEREVGAYARANGIPFEEARAQLKELV